MAGHGDTRPSFSDRYLRTLLDEAMDAYEVSTMVNAARNDGPEIIARVN